MLLSWGDDNHTYQQDILCPQASVAMCWMSLNVLFFFLHACDCTVLPSNSFVAINILAV